MQQIGSIINFQMPEDVRARLEARKEMESLTPQRSSASQGNWASCPDCFGTLWVREADSPKLTLCSCQRPRRIEQYRADSNVPGIYASVSLATFDLRYYSASGRQTAESAFTEVTAYIEQFGTMRRGLYLTSRTKGSGKTLLACIIANELINRAVRARFVGMAQLLADIKATFNAETGESESQIITAASTAPVLILDDIGVEKPTEWAANVLYRLLDARLVSARPTIFTSNVPIDDLKYDDRIVDRIRRMAYVVQLPEESVRSKLAAVEDMRMKRMLGGIT